MLPPKRESLLGFWPETVLAAKAVFALASLRNKEGMEAKAVAEEVGCDLQKMASVLSCLERAGLVEQDQGASGSFRLRRGPHSVSLYDVAEAVGEDFDVCSFLRNGKLDERVLKLSGLDALANRLREKTIALLKSRTIGQLTVARA